MAELWRGGGHRVIVASRGGRLEDEIDLLGAEFVRLDVESNNPLVMLRSAFALARIMREKRCDLVHAHGRAAAWSACMAGRMSRVPLLTTWYKGFREQNAFKRLYNSVMVRGERVVAVSDQIAELIVERYHIPASRIAVVSASIDTVRFDRDAAWIEEAAPPSGPLSGERHGVWVRAE